VTEILIAMKKVALMSNEEKEERVHHAVNWFERHYDSKNAMPKYIDLLSKVSKDV
jgi:hypothetical protein